MNPFTGRRIRGDVRTLAVFHFFPGLLLALVLATGVCFGQGSTASITGTVTDSTGAVIPGASVTVTETQTGVSHSITTGNGGDYQIPFLPVGVYSVSVHKDGFESTTRSGLKLNVADVARSDFKLNVGQATQNVQVQADAIQVNSENAEVSQTVTERQVHDLPLNGRNFTSLMLIDSTASPTFNTDSAGFLPSQGGQVSVGGSHQSSNGYSIDGLNNRDITLGAPILVPSIDAIDQFKDQNKTFSAEFGSSVNQVNISIKSGTNSLHGTVYEFLRNNVLDAKTWSAVPQTSAENLKQNQFGYSLGGPVIVPRLYNGRDKTFFFASYEGFRHVGAGAPFLIQVPTAAEWNGACRTTCKDPLTGQPFANNMVPSNRISAFAKAIQPFVYQPNTQVGNNNYTGTISTPFNTDQQIYKIDEHLTQKDSAFFRYATSSQSIASVPGGIFGTQINGSNSDLVSTNVDTTGWQGNYTRVFSPNVVNNVSFGRVEISFNTDAPTNSASEIAALGINGGYPGQKQLPAVQFLNGETIDGFGVNTNYPVINHQIYWNVVDTLQMTHGKHSISVGGSLLKWHSYNGTGANFGTWQFNGNASGDPFVDFLLGYPNQIAITVPTPLAPTAQSVLFDNPQYALGFYGSDQWKVTQRLSLNMGLRWEYISIPVEAQNRFGWINPNYPGGGMCTSSQKAVALVGQTGALKYCGAAPNPAPKLSFAPRFGFAYQLTPSGSTVLRGGAGVYFDGPEEQDQPNAGRFYPFQASLTLTATAAKPLTTTMPIPSITSFTPFDPKTQAPAFPAASPRLNPYYTEWTLAISQRLPLRTVLDVIYSGTEGTHEQTRANINMAAAPTDPNNPTPSSHGVSTPTFRTSGRRSTGSARTTTPVR